MIKVLFSTLAILMLVAYGQVIAQSGKTIDKIVAVVGNEIITSSELELQMLTLSMRTKVDPKDPVVRRRVLDELMNRKLILAQAVLDSVVVSEEMVSAQLNEQIRMLEQRYGSVQKLEEAAGMSIAQMKREFREDIKKNLMIETIQREKFGSITVTHREVEEFAKAYLDSLPQVPEQVQLKIISIFPRVMESFKETARKKADDILDSLKTGADFGEMAKKYSDDPGSARIGGDLGIARRGLFVKEFEEAAFALQPGQLSPVIETQFGYHVIKLIERKGEAIRASHILIRVQKTGESDTAAIDRLKDIKMRIISGDDFVLLARKNSEDQETANFGGDMGILEVSQLSTDLQLVQQKLKPGEISDPVRISFEKDYAYAIVRLERRIPPHAPNLTDDYQKISNFAKVFKQNRMYADWIEKIKDNVYWKVMLQ